MIIVIYLREYNSAVFLQRADFVPRLGICQVASSYGVAGAGSTTVQTLAL